MLRSFSAMAVSSTKGEQKQQRLLLTNRKFAIFYLLAGVGAATHVKTMYVEKEAF